MTTEQQETEIEGGSKMALVTRRAAQLDAAEWPDERIGAIMRTCTPKGTTPAQFAIFLATANRYDLNPLLREIWLADMKGKLTVVVGRDAYVKVASRQKGFRGFVSGVVYSKDTFRAHRSGDQVVVEHLVESFDRGTIVGAYCVVHVEGQPDALVLRRWEQFKHLYNKDVWQQNPDTMLETRVIVTALKLRYNLAGIEEETTLEEIASRAALPVGTPNADRAASATQETIDALRGRLRAAETREPEVVEVAVEKTDEELAMEEKLREAEELELLRVEDPDAYAAAMERKAIAEEEGLAGSDPGE